LGRANSKTFEIAKYIREPKPNKFDSLFFYRLDYELLSRFIRPQFHDKYLSNQQIDGFFFAICVNFYMLDHTSTYLIRNIFIALENVLDG
jgi:hypothetical protein